MRAYIDNENKLHVENDGTMTPVDIDFGGQCKRVIEAYKYYPDKGLLILWANADSTFGAQALYSEMYDSIAKAVETLDDEASEEVTDLFPFWSTDTEYSVGDRRQYNGLLYRCVQAHTSQADWMPPAVPALWVRTSTEEWPEWVQPTGAHDAYNAGDKVSHNGKHWVSDIDANVYEPGVYGWTEVE